MQNNGTKQPSHCYHHGNISYHFCFILSMGTRIRTDSVMRPWCSRSGHNISASVTVTVTIRKKLSSILLTNTSCDHSVKNVNTVAGHQ